MESISMNKLYLNSILNGKFPLCENISTNHSSRKQRQSKLPILQRSPHRITFSTNFKLIKEMVLHASVQYKKKELCEFYYKMTWLNLKDWFMGAL